MNYLDLFHGIGGFALGAYWAGMKFEHHYCSDIEPWCQELYAKRFPDSVQLGDITKIDATELPAGDWIITGGFPCQDISIAGKGAGIHGERSGLWFEYWRLINDLRPRFAIMENVGMLVHRGLREVLGSLAEIGYNAEWQDIRASDMGAPHRRERIWIVAYPDSNKCSEQVGRKNEFETSEEIKDGQNYNATRKFSGAGTTKLYNKRCKDEDVADTGLQRQTEHEEQATRIKQCCEAGNVADTNDTRAYRRGMQNNGCWSQDDKKRFSQSEFSEEGKMADTSITGLQGQEPARCRPGKQGLPPECGDEFPDAKGERGRCRDVRGQGKPGHASGHGKRGDNIGAGKEINASREWWSTEPNVGMLVNGISVKLVGGLNYAGMESQKSGTESAPENGEMRVVRSNGEITETPSGHKKGNRNNNTVPDMSCKSGQIARDEKIKTDAEMCGVRKDIQSSRQPHSQNLQLRLSENPRERKRIEAVAWECEPAEIGRLATGVKNRVDRLKGLGNAIVPQIAELLFRQIMKVTP